MKLELTVGEFIENFVVPNTLVRLQYNIPGGHEEVTGNVAMEWAMAKDNNFKNRKVIGVTDILYGGSYPEAVNLVIER